MFHYSSSYSITRQPELQINSAQNLQIINIIFNTLLLGNSKYATIPFISKTFQAYSIHIPLPLYRWDVRKHHFCRNITLYKWRLIQRYRATKRLHTVDREPGPRQKTKTPSQLIWKLSKINFLFLLFQRMFLHMVAFLICVNIIVLTIIFLFYNHSFYEFISNLWVYQFISNCIDNYIPFL